MAHCGAKYGTHEAMFCIELPWVASEQAFIRMPFWRLQEYKRQNVAHERTVDREKKMPQDLTEVVGFSIL